MLVVETVENNAESWVRMPANKRRREVIDRWDVNAFLFFVSIGGLFGWQIDRKGDSEWMQALAFAVVITGYSMLRVCIRSIPGLSSDTAIRLKQIRPRQSTSAQVTLTIRQDGVVTGEDEGWFSCDHQGLEFVGLRSRVAVPRCLITDAKLRHSWLIDRLRCEVELPGREKSVTLEFLYSGFGETRLSEIVTSKKLVRSTDVREYEDTLSIPLEVQEGCKFDRGLFWHELASGCLFGLVMWTIFCYENPTWNSSQVRLIIALLAWVMGGIALTSIRNLYRGWKMKIRMPSP